ncbi:MAG TPA: hypothetical protein PKZ41_01385 [Candidatus Omnitrophota bacterium]|nr:hypothetical protein [Candidatus Omnitrophota bacterium]
MAQKTEKWDSIDSELARTYFNPMENGRRVFPAQAKVPHHALTIRKTAAILTALAAAGLAFILAVNVMNGIKSSSAHARKNSVKNLPLSYAFLPIEMRNEKILYDFETSKDGWEIPLWASEKEDHTQRSMDISSDISSRGEKSLKITSDFIPGKWVASIGEIQHYLDLSDYDAVSVDIYLPPDAPSRGFRAKLIFTVGEDWKFIEMSRSVRLENGKWNNIFASIKPDSKDWKWTKVNESFKEDVRKISLRVEYEGKDGYSGPVYIDNFRTGNTGPAGPENL